MAFWHVILPVEQVNLIQNPSGERGTTGWGTIHAGTVGTTSTYQQFGAWSGSVAPTSSGTAGAHFGTWQAGDGTAYSVSASVRGAAGVSYMLAVAATNNALVSNGSVLFTGGGTWHRYSLSYIESGGATRRVLVRKNGDASTDAFYVDGVDVVVGSVTTHIDGDQDGCAWTATPHNSTSRRSGQSRAGGSVVALESLGLKPNNHLGIGMPPLQNTFVSYAITDGAEFQRQRAAERVFTLTSTLTGTTTADFHVTRDRVINALKIDAVTPQQPVRFLYAGARGTVQIDAVLDGDGLGLTQMNGPMAEDAGVQFVAGDPYWRATTDEGTALAAFTNLGSAKYIAARDPYGRWGTLGVNGTTFNIGPSVIFPASNGLVYVGGAFGSAGGTQANSIAQYDPATNRWGTMTTGVIADFAGVEDMAEAPNGDIYVAIGGGGSVGGTQMRGVGYWRPSAAAWGTLANGGVSGAGAGTRVKGLTFGLNGTLYVGGNFNAVAGTTAGSVAQYSPVDRLWGTMASGISAGTVATMATGLNGQILIGGEFASVGGTANANNVAFWEPVTSNWGTMAGGVTVEPNDPDVRALTVAPNGITYVGGAFQLASGGSATNFTAWNGVTLSRIGALTSQLDDFVSNLCAGTSGEIFLAGGFLNAGSVAFPDRMAAFNGYSFLPLDIILPNLPTVNALALSRAGTLYVGYSNAGTATAASVATIINTGRAIVQPIFRCRNFGAGTARVYQLLNTLTNDKIYFNLVLQPGEEITLNLIPGQRSFTSSFRGTIANTVLPGSNLANWKLLPGTNYVSFFSDSGSIQTSLSWRPRHWSVDGGTVAQ
jgi:hypothetical protein